MDKNVLSFEYAKYISVPYYIVIWGDLIYHV